MIPSEIRLFYDRYKKRLYNTALRITGNSMDAEEVAQDTIIKYIRFNTEKLSPQQTGVWLHRACVNGAIDRVRRGKALRAMLEQYAEDVNGTDEDPWNDILACEDTQSLMARIKRKIQELPEGYRIVLSLLLFEGYDYAECAAILKVGESSVRSQYLRGKRKLAELVSK